MTSTTNCKGPHSTIAVFHKDTTDIIRKHVYEILWYHFIESECIHDSAFAHCIVRHGSKHIIIKTAFQFFIFLAFYIFGGRKNPLFASIFLLGSAGTIIGGLTKRNSFGLGI